MELQIVGTRVSEVVVGFAVTIRTGESSEYEVQIEGDLEIAEGLGPARRVESERYEEQRERIESLVGSVVTAAAADGSGSLTLELNSEVTVRVPPDIDYEAWSLVGPGGYRIVCLPGGEMAIWSAK